MLTKFICLANSYKEGGRCIAGIELDADNNPVLINGSPKWIRPVSLSLHGKILNKIAEPFKLLDIIEMNVTENKPEGYQSENVLFREDSIRAVGIFDKNRLAALCENRKYIFSTRYPSLSEEVIKELTYSLILVKPEKFEVIEKVFENKAHARLSFFYNGFQYDFSITDPVFLNKYEEDPDFVEDLDEVMLTLSVGVRFPRTNMHYKLVAGIIF